MADREDEGRRARKKGRGRGGGRDRAGTGKLDCHSDRPAGETGIQMGKTPLCTPDAAEPVAGGATADKYVSRQHHGVAHRAEPSRAAPSRGLRRHGDTAARPRREPHGIPHRVPRGTPPNSSSPPRASPSSLSRGLLTLSPPLALPRLLRAFGPLLLSFLALPFSFFCFPVLAFPFFFPLLFRSSIVPLEVNGFLLSFAEDASILLILQRRFRAIGVYVCACRALLYI